MAETDIGEKKVECGFEEKTRFPEFLGAEVRLVSLSDVTKEVKVRNGQKHSAASVMGVSKVDGIVPMEARLIASDIARYKVVEHNSFAYNPMRLNIGSIARWDGGSEILVSPDYVVFKCVSKHDHGLIPEYLDHFRQTKAWESFVAKGGDGGVRVRIYYKDLAQLRLAVPSISEQQKIADCLTSIDELIAAQARKVDALKTHKQGLMQQLFPRKGESKPKLRIPPFQNAGEWERKRLDELVVIQSGVTPSKANLAFWKGSIPWVTAKDMKRVFLEDAIDHISDEAIHNGARIVPAGTLLMLTRGMTLLNDVPICILQREMSFNQDVKGLRPKRGIDGHFMAWMLISNKKRLLTMVNVAGHGTGKLDTDKLKALELMLPRLAEQRRIALCLRSIDALINAEAQQLDVLKSHKTGLMQQLFPSLEEIDK